MQYVGAKREILHFVQDDKSVKYFMLPVVSRREHAIEAAKLMLNAAHTAPCAGGVDHMEGELVWGEREQEEIASA